LMRDLPEVGQARSVLELQGDQTKANEKKENEEEHEGQDDCHQQSLTQRAFRPEH